jgi:hypothetical protein
MSEHDALPSRRDVERALRGEIKLERGLSHRQARKLVGLAWAAVVGEARAEADELRAELERFSCEIGGRGAE